MLPKVSTDWRGIKSIKATTSQITIYGDLGLMNDIGDFTCTVTLSLLSLQRNNLHLLNHVFVPSGTWR